MKSANIFLIDKQNFWKEEYSWENWINFWPRTFFFIFLFFKREHFMKPFFPEFVNKILKREHFLKFQLKLKNGNIFWNSKKVWRCEHFLTNIYKIVTFCKFLTTFKIVEHFLKRKINTGRPTVIGGPTHVLHATRLRLQFFFFWGWLRLQFSLPSAGPCVHKHTQPRS